jgi:uncharacterized phage-associated protein
VACAKAPMTFNARKAAQIIAFFIMKSGTTSIDVLKAVKLVYLGDRQSIEDFGFPITNDSHVSMPHGPVNSTTYRHVNGEYDLDACGWSEFLEGRANYQIGAKDKFDLDSFDELSEADIQALNKVWSRFGHMTKWELRDWTHNRKNVPEWEDPHGSSQPIPLERILTLLQIENADEHADLIEDHKYIDRVFQSLRE